MAVTNERFVVNETGERVAVLLDLEAYESLLEALEELESIRAYDAAKVAPPSESIPFREAVAEIERDRE